LRPRKAQSASVTHRFCIRGKRRWWVTPSA